MAHLEHLVAKDHLDLGERLVLLDHQETEGNQDLQVQEESKDHLDSVGLLDLVDHLAQEVHLEREERLEVEENLDHQAVQVNFIILGIMSKVSTNSNNLIH